MAEDEEYSKEIIEGIRLEAVDNILKYQAKTKKWKDKSIVRNNIQEGDLVLRRKENVRQQQGNYSQSGKALT
jgi:hypothetical protein